MGWKLFFKRAGVIAVVLIVMSWTTFAAQEWAYHRAWQDPRIGCGNVEHPWDPTVLDTVNHGLLAVALPALPLDHVVQEADERHTLAALAIGSLIWGVVLAGGWPLLDRYRRRGLGGTLRL